MSTKGTKRFQAFVEDAEESAGPVAEDIVPPSNTSSRTRETANSKKTRSSEKLVDQSDDDSTLSSPKRHNTSSRKDKTSPTSSKSGSIKSSSSKAKEKERPSDKERREKERRPSKPAATVAFSDSRPVLKQTKTTPAVHHGRNHSQSQYYGIPPQQAAPTRNRPQAESRPHQNRLSRHAPPANTGYPPQSNTAFYEHPVQIPHPYGSSPLANHLYHPHPGMGYPPEGEFPPPGYDPMQAQQDNLRQRFGPVAPQRPERPSSAMAVRGSVPPRSNPFATPPHPQEFEERPPIPRRPSTKRRDPDRERDARQMLPPMRPKSTKLPPQVHRTRRYENEEPLVADSGHYQDVRSNRRSGDYTALANSRSPVARRPSVHYHEEQNPLAQSASMLRRHRNSHYEPHQRLDDDEALAESFDEKFNLAQSYQQNMSGGGKLVPLTKAALSKASKRSQGGSSRSTRSTNSQDESDYRHSNTTRTTRSIGVDDDVTIKVPAQLVEESGGKLDITITTARRPHPQAIMDREVSESEEDEEDDNEASDSEEDGYTPTQRGLTIRQPHNRVTFERHGRDRPQNRTRAMSQSTPARNPNPFGLPPDRGEAPNPMLPRTSQYSQQPSFAPTYSSQYPQYAPQNTYGGHFAPPRPEFTTHFNGY